MSVEFSIQKLWNKSHFQQIYNYNKSTKGNWEKIYPKHLAWVSKVVSELINDTYSRIAFGGFFWNDKKRKWELCSSVLVRKNPFSPYLEIKNLLLFRDNTIFDDVENRRKCESQLIKHIIKFAEQRGYPKLVTELFNRNTNDKELIKSFIENDFIIAGNHIDKYYESNDIIFLTSNINQVYGFDPFDNISATKWILNKYLNSEDSELTANNVDIVDNKNQKHPATSINFFRGKKFDSSSVEAKFNIEECICVIEEYLKPLKGFEYITEIIFKKGYSKKLIFDFSNDNFKLKSTLTKSDDLTIFSKEDLNYLLGFTDKPNVQRTCNYENLGGILLISNPIRFPFEKIERILKSGKKAIYIKLGDYGKFINEDMRIILAYYHSDTNRSEIHIWGTAILSDPAKAIDLEDFQKTNSDELLLHKEIPSVTNSLFNFLVEEGDEEILWEPHEFEKHNAYNETNRIVCFSIAQFFDLRKSLIRVSSFLEDPDYINDIENVFDFYITKKEVQIFDKQLEQIEINKTTTYFNNITEKDSFSIKKISKKRKNTPKIIKIFLASSAELEEDRKEFREFISIENDKYTDEGIYLRIIQWEYFLDTISETRKQDDYNKEVVASDIFLSLFFTKVGKFSNEEFDKAYGQFIKTGKPKVFTYFKHSGININELNRNDFNSKIDFEEKLNALGHFPSKYKNLDDLKVQFKRQLEILVPNILQDK